MADTQASGKTTRALTVALCGGYFLILLDVTVVNVALPSIGHGLHASSAGLAWVVDAYTVPLAALLLAAGAIGDVLGHRRIVLLGFAGFGGASVLCALAPALAVLAAGRALQGICAALMLPGTLAMLTHGVADDRERTRVVGIWAAIGGAALPTGPFVGGVLVQLAGWRSVFWLNVPVIAVALAVVLRAPADQPKRSGSVDWAGAVAMVVAIGALVVGIIESHRQVFVLVAGLAVAVLAAGALVLIERHASDPLIVIPRGSRRALATACGLASIMNLTVLGSLFLLTQLLQSVHGLGPFVTGLVLLPAMAPLPLLARPASKLIARIGVWRTAALGTSTAAAGYLVISQAVHGPEYPLLIAGFLLWGGGVGLLTPAVVAGALDALPDTPGLASGASNTSRQTGAAVGVALFGAVAGAAGSRQFTAHLQAVEIGCAVAFALGCGLALWTSPGQRAPDSTPSM